MTTVVPLLPGVLPTRPVVTGRSWLNELGGAQINDIPTLGSEASGAHWAANPDFAGSADRSTYAV